MGASWHPPGVGEVKQEEASVEMFQELSPQEAVPLLVEHYVGGSWQTFLEKLKAKGYMFVKRKG